MVSLKSGGRVFSLLSLPSFSSRHSPLCSFRSFTYLPLAYDRDDRGPTIKISKVKFWLFVDVAVAFRESGVSQHLNQATTITGGT